MLKQTELQHSLWACPEKLEKDNVLGPRMEVEPGTKDLRYLYIDALMSLLKSNSDMIE